MEITRRRRLVPDAQPLVTGSLVELYPCDLQLYRIPPTFTITLAEFEELAQERLKLLRTVDQINLKGISNWNEWKTALIAELRKIGLKGYAKLINGAGCGKTEAELQLRKRDHISHFILRLAYCKSEELRRWFIQRELDLFKVRFHSLNAEGVQCFLQTSKLKYESISEEEKTDLRECLYESSAGITSPANVYTHDFFRVPFYEVQDLVRGRKVYLNAGFAYVPSTDFVSIMATVFRTNLAHGMAVAANKLPFMEGDERIFSLLKDLHQSYTGEEYTGSKNSNSGSVKIEDLDMLSRHSFPPCMRQLHEHLCTTHHMKHGGRMQYGLFLKGIGLSLEDAMRFWREEFCKLIDVDKFEKNYAYNIRHNYGKEGKRTNYTPYSCLKIIMSSVGPDDSHGCPFKHNDLANLKQKLLKWNIPVGGINEVAQYVQQGHYQLACGKYFQITHGTDNDVAINHPNQYFTESQNVLAEKHGVKVESNSVPKGRTVKSETVSADNTVAKEKTVNPEPMDVTWGEDIDVGCLEKLDC